MINKFDLLSEHDKINTLAAILSIKGLVTDKELELVSEKMYEASIEKAEKMIVSGENKL